GCHFLYSDLSTGAGRTRAAAHAGRIATRLATTRVVAARARKVRRGTAGRGTIPSWWANTIHTHRPHAMPTGMPTAAATKPSVVACHATVVRTWPDEKPMVLSTARSRLRLRIEVTNR